MNLNFWKHIIKKKENNIPLTLKGEIKLLKNPADSMTEYDYLNEDGMEKFSELTNISLADLNHMGIQVCGPSEDLKVSINWVKFSLYMSNTVKRTNFFEGDFDCVVAFFQFIKKTILK